MTEKCLKTTKSSCFRPYPITKTDKSVKTSPENEPQVSKLSNDLQRVSQTVVLDGFMTDLTRVCDMAGVTLSHGETVQLSGPEGGLKLPECQLS